MSKSAGRYSVLIRPFTYLFDLFVLNLSVYFVLPVEYHILYFYFFTSISWIIIAINVGFYDIYRFTKGVTILEKIVKQFITLTIVSYSFSGFYFNNVKSFRIANYILFSILFIAFFKFSVYYLLKKYRSFLGGNFRQVVIIGKPSKTDELKHFFNENLDYGYKLVQDYTINKSNENQMDQILLLIKNQEEKIDEIYCSIADITDEQRTKIIDFCDNNLLSLKFIPEKDALLLDNYKYDYYGYLPIISLREIPLDDTLNKFLKRIFDIIFSILIIVGILSWLTPIIAFFIKFESKGSIFFKQKRNGLNYKEFYCYKFRSMQPNKTADLAQVSKNDPRITKFGKFLRKSSLDELPQFFNVFLGDMSVVGPRPHMISETERFAAKVDKFMVRHFIKPGITGLAQTKGYRGEVETDKDIINRVKYDIYYIENWSLFLDLKIIVLTIYNAIKGEEKAY